MAPIAPILESRMIANRRYPEGLFVGSPDRLNQIRAQIAGY